MTRQRPANLPASVHQRLLTLSRQRGEEFNRLLTLYAIERLLYRLAQSPYADRFVLKGALLFLVWAIPGPRPTRDLDLLGFGDNSTAALTQVFQTICKLPVIADGLDFDTQSIRISEIREDQEYQGQRVELVALLGLARVPLQVDIGFGDLVSPAPREADYPALLEFPSPRLRIYSMESVIAEKLHAMVILDLTNSRMKDFYDLWILSRLFPFTGQALAYAIQSTFARRQTLIPPTTPTALMPAFATDSAKITQWQAFLNRNRLQLGGVPFAQVIADLQVFLLPPLQALTHQTPFNAAWTPAVAWT